MEKIALTFEEKFKNVTHIAHTYKLDDHLQHLKMVLLSKIYIMLVK